MFIALAVFSSNVSIIAAPVDLQTITQDAVFISFVFVYILLYHNEYKGNPITEIFFMYTKIIFTESEIKSVCESFPGANGVTLLVLLTDYITQTVPVRF